MSVRRVLVRTAITGGLAAGLSLPLALGSGALADPKGDTFSLTCGSTTYQVVVNGNGGWTPAHDTNSNLVFIPHAFTGFHGEVYDDQGVFVESFDEPAWAQGSGKQKNDMSCTFSFEDVSDGSDPEFPAGYTFTGSGGVTGQIAGRA